MTLLIGFLTFVLVVNCLFLILLVLIQLPKKEAGAGIAFGGGATDALFGAGSGNALTKLTKYSASVFIGLALVLTILNTQKKKTASQGLENELKRQQAAASSVTAPPAAPLITSNSMVPLQPKAATPNPAASTTPTATSMFQIKPSPAAAAPAIKVSTNAVQLKTNSPAAK